jgi:hypothetical protein
MIEYILMHNPNLKYIHYNDRFGDLIGSLDRLQPGDTDTIFVTVIAERGIGGSSAPGGDDWSTITRGTMIAVNLKKVKKWKFYEDYEEFCAEFIEAIL